MLENTTQKPSKFETKHWEKINDDANGTYNTSSQVKFKTTTLKWKRLSNFNGAYIGAKETITVATNTQASPDKNNNKQVIFKSCAPYTDCISEMNNTQVDNAKDLNVVMPMYNLIEYSYNYSNFAVMNEIMPKDIIISYKGLLKNNNFSIKTTND